MNRYGSLVENCQIDFSNHSWLIVIPASCRPILVATQLILDSSHCNMKRSGWKTFSQINFNSRLIAQIKRDYVGLLTQPILQCQENEALSADWATNDTLLISFDVDNSRLRRRNFLRALLNHLRSIEENLQNRKYLGLFIFSNERNCNEKCTYPVWFDHAMNCRMCTRKWDDRRALFARHSANDGILDNLDRHFDRERSVRIPRSIERDAV